MSREMTTKKELAAEYRVTLRTITNWMTRGRISYMKIGRLVRFHRPTVRGELQTAGYVEASSK